MFIIRFILSLSMISFLFISISYASDIEQKNNVLDIQKITTPKGLEIWFVEDHSVPVIATSFSFKGGISNDPKGKGGLAHMASILLDEGADELNSKQFQEQLSNNAISLGFSAGRDSFSGRLQTLTRNKDTAFKLLKRALTKPHFEKEAITRMKNANISGIKRNLGSPSWLIARSFNGIAFENHSYARPGHGTIESVTSITDKDLHQFVKNYFHQSGLVISVSGDITANELSRIIDSSFGQLPETGVTPENTETKIQNIGKTYLYPFDSPQSFISIGQQGITRNDQNWQTAQLMNYILGGGGFSSRLMQEIRVKHGLTYGVYSHLSTQDFANVLQFSMSTKNETAKQSLDLIKQEWQKMANTGPTTAELKDAKAYITGSLPLHLTSNASIAETLNSLQTNRRDINYINTRNDKINAVTLEQAKKFSHNFLTPDKSVIVLVGKPENVTTDVKLTSIPNM